MYKCDPILGACILQENLQTDSEDGMLCSPTSANIVNAIHKFDSTSLIMLREQLYQKQLRMSPKIRVNLGACPFGRY